MFQRRQHVGFGWSWVQRFSPNCGMSAPPTRICAGLPPPICRHPTFQLYRRLFNIFCNYLHTPDILVFLNCKPEEALRRVRVRARGCETGMTVEYLRALRDAYEEWLADIEPRIPVLRLDWNQFHPTCEVVRKIQEKLQETRKGIVI